MANGGGCAGASGGADVGAVAAANVFAVVWGGGKAGKVGGATLTGMLGTSAWYAPGAAVSALVQAIACDQKKMFPCSLMLNGEYGQSDICLGVPAILGSNGVEKIVEIELNDAEKAKFNESADAVRVVNGDLASVLA